MYRFATFTDTMSIVFSELDPPPETGYIRACNDAIEIKYGFIGFGFSDLNMFAGHNFLQIVNIQSLGIVAQMVVDRERIHQRFKLIYDLEPSLFRKAKNKF